MKNRIKRFLMAVNCVCIVPVAIIWLVVWSLSLLPYWIWTGEKLDLGSFPYWWADNISERFK